jgi:agmatine/peptidylarginine deiminase
MWTYDAIDHIMVDLKMVIGLVTMTFMARTNLYKLHQIPIQPTYVNNQEGHGITTYVTFLFLKASSIIQPFHVFSH